MSSENQKFEGDEWNTNRRTVIHSAEEREAQMAKESFAEHLKAGAKKDVDRTANAISDEGLFTAILKTTAKIIRTVITFPFNAIGSALVAVGIVKPDPRVIELMQKNEAMNRARKEKAEKEAMKNSARHADLGNSVPESERSEQTSEKEEKTEKASPVQPQFTPDELTEKPAKKGIREYMMSRNAEIFRDSGGNAFLASYKTDTLHGGSPKLSAGRIASALDITAETQEDHFTNAVFAAAYISSRIHGRPVRVPGVPGMPDNFAVVADKSIQLVKVGPDKNIQEVLCDCTSSWPPQFAEMARKAVEKETGRDPVKSINMDMVKSYAEKSEVYMKPEARKIFEDKKAKFYEKIQKLHEKETEKPEQGPTTDSPEEDAPKPDDSPSPDQDEPDPQPEPDNGPSPEPDSGPEPEPDNGPEPEPDNGPEPFPDPEGEPQPEPEVPSGGNEGNNAPHPEPDTGPAGGTSIPHPDFGPGARADTYNPWGNFMGTHTEPLGGFNTQEAQQQASQIGNKNYTAKDIADFQIKLTKEGRGFETFSIPGREERFVCITENGICNSDYVAGGFATMPGTIAQAMNALMIKSKGSLSMTDYIENDIAAATYCAMEYLKNGEPAVAGVAAPSIASVYGVPKDKIGYTVVADGDVLGLYGPECDKPIVEGSVAEPQKFSHDASNAFIKDLDIDISKDATEVGSIGLESVICDDRDVHEAAATLNGSQQGWDAPDMDEEDFDMEI